MLRLSLLTGFAIALSACATTKTPPETPVTLPPISAPEIPTPTPKPPVYVPPPVVPTRPNDPEPTAPEPEAPKSEEAFKHLERWKKSDTRPALIAFRRNCDVWNKKSPAQAFSSQHPEFGTFGDWQALCGDARRTGDSEKEAKTFFETYFYPLLISSNQSGGLLTGYYQPEVDVRAVPDSAFSEPILSVPARDSDRLKPREEINASTSRVIAYGRPIDVFFMQVQGSGILVFKNGYKVRAAYAANNDKPYTSIGGVLIRRGELSKDKSGMRDLEGWMVENGPAATTALFNENKRYIFFSEETIVPGEGPMGGMRVPLTAMGSMAVDTAHYPYGLPVFLNVKIPQAGGDYRGKEQGLLLIAQDTGKAIRGERRGDIYFGGGHAAGAKAGVMKHKGKWAILIPRTLLRHLPIS